MADYEGQDFDSLPSYEGQDFDSLPEKKSPDASAQQPAPQQSYAGQDFDTMPTYEGHDFDSLPEKQEKPPAPESALGSAVRAGAHAAIPSVAAVPAFAAGAEAGGAIGALGGPLGAGAGALIGGVLAGGAAAFATNKVQDAALSAIGADDSMQLAADAAAHPYTTAAGELVPAALAFRPDRAATAMQRAAGALMMGGLDVGTQLATEGRVDPGRAAIAAAGGAVLTKPTALGERLNALGERAGQAVTVGAKNVWRKNFQPKTVAEDIEADSSQAPVVSQGGTTQQAPPSAEGVTTGNPQSAPVRSDRLYGKARRPQGSTVDQPTEGDFDPATRAALQSSLEQNAVGGSEPGAMTIPRPIQQATAPEEQFPIDTGIEAAANQPTPPAEPRVETGLEEAAQAQPQLTNPNAAKPTLTVKRPETPADVQRRTGLPYKEASAEAERQGWTVRPPAEEAPHPLQEKLEAEAPKVNTEPTAAQIDADNYAKGHVRLAGRDVSIENPAGSVRKSKPGVEPPWEAEVPYHYGDFKGTKGADGDPIDVAIAHGDDFGDKHFIIDQKDADTGKFDEHKVFAHFKDEDTARKAYEAGFTDGKGPDRLQAITEVTEPQLKKWLDIGNKKQPYAKAPVAAPPAPKVVTATVKALREKGTPDAVALANTIEALPSGRQVVEAARASAMLTNKTGKVPEAPLANARIRSKPPEITVPGVGTVTARTLGDAQRKATALQGIQEAFDKYGPKSAQEHPNAFDQRLTDAFEEAGQHLETYKPRVKPASYLWMRAAKRYLDGTRTDAQRQKFLADELQLRSGNPEDVTNVRQGNRIEADIARQRTGGDEAIAGAENKAAQGYLDVPHEEAEKYVEPVEAREVESLPRKTLDLTKTEDRDELARDTNVITENLIKEEDHAAPSEEETRAANMDRQRRAREAAALAGRKSAAPDTESEGAASAPRKVIVDDASRKAALDAFAKAEARSKSRAAPQPLPPEKEPTVIPEEKKLIAFWNNERGGLNLPKIANAMKTTTAPIKNALEKYIGVPASEVGRKADAIFAQVMSHANQLAAEKAHQLDAEWYSWLQRPKANVMKYLSALENPANKTRQDVVDELKAKGVPHTQAEQMGDSAELHRYIMNKIFLEDMQHGSTAEYRENYVPHIFEDTKVNGKTANEFLQDRINALGSRWYQKQRTFDLIDEAVKAGFKLKFDNPIDLINARWAASIRANMLVAAARKLQDSGLAFPVKEAPDYVKRTWTMKRNLPDHRDWLIAPGAENLWVNAMEPKGLGQLSGPIGSVYRAWMKLKNVWAPVQLAFSAFHELHIAANINPAMNLARAIKLSVNDPSSTGRNFWQAAKYSLADPILSLPLDKLGWGLGRSLDDWSGRAFSEFRGREAMNFWQKPAGKLNADDRMWQQLFKEGGISPYQADEDVIGAKRALAQAMADNAYLRIAGNSLRRGIEKIQEPMFKYQIPALKNVAFMRNVEAAFKMDPTLATNSAKRGAVLRELGKNIDDRFGEMFYKSLFWNKVVKDIGVGSMLSLSWNVGQLRQAGGALQNLQKTFRVAGGKNGMGSPMQEAKYKAGDKGTFVGAYVGLSMATAGAISAALSGKLPTGLDYVFPRNGLTNPDGTPQRLSTPFNTREPFMLKAHAEQHNSWVGGAMEFLWNKMILSPIVEAAQNKDFYGHALYDTSAPWYKKAPQLVDSVLGAHFSPISLAGADRAAEQGGGAREKALAYAGFSPAPKYVNATPLQNRINSLFSEHAVANSKPYEYGEKTGLGRGLVQGAIRNVAGDELKSEARTEARGELNRGVMAGDRDQQIQARRDLALKGEMSPRTAVKINPRQEYEYKFARLPVEDQMTLARGMDPKEFNQFVVLNKNPGILKTTRAKLMRERNLINP